MFFEAETSEAFTVVKYEALPSLEPIHDNNGWLTPLQGLSHDEQLVGVLLGAKVEEINWQWQNWELSVLPDLLGDPLGVSASEASLIGQLASPSIPDFAGNTLSSARLISLSPNTTTFRDWVGTTDTNDYYRFTLNQRSEFRLTLSGMTADADVELLNGAGEVIDYSVRGGTSNETITQQLNSGTYFIRVYPYGQSATYYDLSVSATPINAPADLAGNTLGQARQISIGTNPVTFRDWVGTSDTNDYYRFTLSQSSNFRLTLSGMTADADVELLDANGQVIQRSINAGSASETISRQLTAGTYYIRVYPFGQSSTYYDLSVLATPALADLAGNTPAQAREISIGSTPTTFTDWVGPQDTNDYYRFTLNQTSNFSLTLTGMSADGDVELLNAAGELIQYSINAGAANEIITRELAPGTYYIRVYPFEQNATYYDLSVAAVPIRPDDLAGNTLAQARQISVGANPITFTDWVGPEDTNDYYRFTLSQTSNFRLTLAGLRADADVELLNASGQVIQRSVNPGTANETIAEQLAPGTYYIRVYPYSQNSTQYELSVFALPISDLTDWFSQNLGDAGIIAQARSRAADGILDRFDVIEILRSAKDDNVIDAVELADLRTIFNNATLFNMPEYVEVLGRKVVFTDPANAWWTGGSQTRIPLGNLFAGSSADHMELLVRKWFGGLDRPALQPVSGTIPVYQYVQGSLFRNGISADDVIQGYLGDCYYLAALAGLAHEQPDRIRNMFIDNGDGTFTVRFFRANGTADYVTVDRALPTINQRAVYAGWSWDNSPASAATNELWVALAEKAYAQIGESGWTRPSYKVNSYSDIVGGWMDDVIKQVGGLQVQTRRATQMTQAQLIDLVNSNNIVTVGFVGLGGDVSIRGQRIIDAHAYTVTAYNPTAQTFFLRNPWGSTHAQLTFAELQSLRARVDYSV